MKSFCIILFVISLTTNVTAQIVQADTLQLVINEQNTMYVQTVFNEIDTLNLNFDTGTTELVLTNETIEHKLKSKVQLYDELYPLKIGNTIYKSKLYDAQLSGHDTDGRFGWDLFKDKIVELNYDQKIMVIHPSIPSYVTNDKSFEKLTIHYFDNVFSVEGTLLQNGQEVKYEFFFDTGYQRTVMLDHDLLKQTKFPTDSMKEIKRVIMKGAQGNEIPVITSNLDGLKLGKYLLKNVPAQMITSRKPMQGHDIHILGNEVLKRFNLFFDFKNELIYLKPNQLFDVDYVEKN